MCETRICTKCNEEKPSTPKYFRRHKRGKNGLYSQCKVCNKREKNLDWAGRLTWGVNYNNKKNERKRGNLTPKMLRELYESQNGLCYYSGIKLDTTRKSKFKAISCDRVDNSKGYTLDNVVLCCRFFNLGRCDGDFDEFKDFLKENIIK